MQKHAWYANVFECLILSGSTHFETKFWSRLCVNFEAVFLTENEF